uniref:Uncharacterized protein n=1 Tax=Arundo donax TaxID=35708 RepID=A0A0A9H962_ARUDO
MPTLCISTANSIAFSTCPSSPQPLIIAFHPTTSHLTSATPCRRFTDESNFPHFACIYFSAVTTEGSLLNSLPLHST